MEVEAVPLVGNNGDQQPVREERHLWRGRCAERLTHAFVSGLMGGAVGVIAWLAAERNIYVGTKETILVTGLFGAVISAGYRDIQEHPDDLDWRRPRFNARIFSRPNFWIGGLSIVSFLAAGGDCGKACSLLQELDKTICGFALGAVSSSTAYTIAAVSGDIVLGPPPRINQD